MGGIGRRVTTRGELAAALEEAATCPGRFWLIEAMLPRGVLSNTLQRFVEGVKRLQRPAGRPG
jgi:indolepyruvate decarboxylase